MTSTLPVEILLKIARECPPKDAKNMLEALFGSEVMWIEMKKRNDCYVWDGRSEIPHSVLSGLSFETMNRLIASVEARLSPESLSEIRNGLF